MSLVRRTHTLGMPNNGHSGVVMGVPSADWRGPAMRWTEDQIARPRSRRAAAEPSVTPLCASNNFATPARARPAAQVTLGELGPVSSARP